MAREQLRDFFQCSSAVLGALIEQHRDPETRTLGGLGFTEPESTPPGYGVNIRLFIAYDTVEPFDTSFSLDKRRGWRDQELCARLYSRLSHNPGTKAWVQQLSGSARLSWRLRSGRFYKWFCRSTATTKSNVDYNSAFGCHRHGNQFLKNLRDQERQRIYFTTDELEDVLKQVEEMKQGMRWKPANDVQFGRHRPQGANSGAPVRGVSGAYAAMATPEVPEP
ncbi:hypothetical protein PHMEG_0006696 [Phytophthora megakarya]|uniref:Uncharacterized protein n=1 Tax=Phytophthora megakarya TaxID=4795 RepID=A0A225WNB6_9STRA|nr:hypothetical protein PHMEG_0006696 [Phytophthora megakarya]